MHYNCGHDQFKYLRFIQLTMFDLRTVNGLVVRRHAFGLFNWIVIG